MRTIPELQEGTHKAKASGILPNGKPVVVNSDGTVSVVAGASGAEGTATTYNSAATKYPNSVYDTANNKVVFAYGDDNVGNAIVGTISGTSISFGSEVRFNPTFSSLYVDSVYDPDSGKIVIVYRDGGTQGECVIGTVSGTSSSFGMPVTFNSGATTWCKVAYDTTNNKVVIAYKDDAVGDGHAIVGTVSGTSISFGSEVDFEASGVSFAGGDPLEIAFDSNSSKVVIAYRDSGNSNYGSAIVGTVSGTSISFGTKTTFASEAVDWLTMDFDTTNNKLLVMYDAGASAGKGIVGTVSGTSISFGTAATFKATSVDDIKVVYGSSEKFFTFIFEDVSNGNDGKLNTATISGTSVSFGTEVTIETGLFYNAGIGYDPNAGQVIALFGEQIAEDGQYLIYKHATSNLTSENYIGMSQGGTVADGSSATVDIIGSLSTNQSGLTAGQQYYVQTDGTIGEAAADPSVFAGTAISATSLVVKT